jgi:hypothetical protein
MNTYFSEHELEEGFEVLGVEAKRERLIRGREISRPSGWALFLSLREQPIRCWACGCGADRWVVSKHRKDQDSKPPVMNLYATAHDGSLVMMTRDHIIPKSLGGVDDVRNLRPACSTCNENRLNDLNDEDLEFARSNPELIDSFRVQKGLTSLKSHLSKLSQQRDTLQKEIEDLERPYRLMGYLSD